MRALPLDDLRLRRLPALHGPRDDRARRRATYDPEKNWVIRCFRRFFPVTDRYEGKQFFTRKDGKLWRDAAASSC